MTLAQAIQLFEFSWESSLLLSAFLPFMVGAAFGSFLNVVILRAPLYDPWSPTYNPAMKLATIGGRSFCPLCGTAIPLWRNMPAISWLLLRGRSACCNKPINPQYLIIEWALGLSFLTLSHTVPPILIAPLFFFMFSAVGILSVYLKYHFLPKNLILVSGAVSGLLFLL